MDPNMKPIKKTIKLASLSKAYALVRAKSNIVSFMRAYADLYGIK